MNSLTFLIFLFDMKKNLTMKMKKQWDNDSGYLIYRVWRLQWAWSENWRITLKFNQEPNEMIQMISSHTNWKNVRLKKRKSWSPIFLKLNFNFVLDDFLKLHLPIKGNYICPYEFKRVPLLNVIFWLPLWV